jgi:EmrB/QacA subfamily drug resistance transporter
MESKASQSWTLALTAVAALLVGLDALVVSTALSTLRAELGASLQQLEWTVNAYVLSFAVLMMTASALGDRFGRRRLFLAGLGLFAAASAGCALAGDVHLLIAARAVQGAGAALIMPLALALLGDAFPPPERQRAIGIFTGVLGIGVPVGPLLGGAVVGGVAWPWIFWLNLPIALVIAALARTRVRESFGPPAALDLPGLALVTAGAFALVWGLVRSNSGGWTSAEVLVALIGGVVLAVAFVAWEQRAPSPMVPMSLFRSPRFSAGNAAIFLLWGSALGSLFFMAQFLQTGLGYGPLGAGVRLLPWTATLTLVAPFAGTLADRFGERPFMAAGLLLQGIGMAWIALIAGPGMPYGELIAPLIVTGSGTSMAMPAMQSAVLGSVAPADIGHASGTFATLRQLGAAFGLAILVAVFAGAGSYASPAAFADGFAPALGVSAGLAFAGALAALLVPARRVAPAAAIPAAKAVTS